MGWEKAKLDFIADHPNPGDDPVQRLHHVNKVYEDVQDVGAFAIIATSGMYDEGRTGLTYADLRALGAILGGS